MSKSKETSAGEAGISTSAADAEISTSKLDSEISTFNPESNLRCQQLARAVECDSALHSHSHCLGAGPYHRAITWRPALVFEIPSKVILQLLGALAPPLILVAVTHVLMTTEVSGKTAGRLAVLLLLNTTVAIVIGMLVANVVQAGNLVGVQEARGGG